jgi:hypothetical protein
MDICRRSFVKSAAIGAAGLTVGGQFSDLIAAPEAGLAWTNGMQINPNISNAKVVCCYDETMLLSKAQAEIASDFSKQNAVVNTIRVEKNLDAMAISLSGKDNAAEAWKTILRTSKTWAQTKAAIKVNCINTQVMVRIAIVGKICQELIRLGVSASNITIFDACHGATGNSKYSPYISTATENKGIPANVKIWSAGTKTNVTVGSSQMSCTNAIIDADILVNCAINKGHSQSDKGGFTLSMKNHTGTLKFSCPTLSEMINQNKSDAIIGGTIPKQQLCIVDSIWAARTGPTDPPSDLPCRIVMGTFGPMVDYAVVKKIREASDCMNMGTSKHNQTAINQIMSGFGYTGSELQWTSVAPVSVASIGNSKDFTQPFAFLLNGNNFRVNKISFNLPANHGTLKLSITDLKGALVNEYHMSTSNTLFSWSGNTRSGSIVAPGKYIIHLMSDNFSMIEHMLVMKN